MVDRINNINVQRVSHTLHYTFFHHVILIVLYSLYAIRFKKLTPAELMNFLMSDKTLSRIASAFDPNKWKHVDGEKFCSLDDA